MKLVTKNYKKYTEDEQSIRNDIIFRAVLGTNERSQYLKELLEGILHRKITNIVIKNDVALEKIHADNKLMRLDILAEVDGKEKINVELQNKNEYNTKERAEAYASGIYYNSLKVSDRYIVTPKIIVIWLLGFNLFKDGTYHEVATIKREYNNEIVSKNVEYHYIQLPKFLKQVNEIKTEEEQWLAYMSGSLNNEEKGELLKMNRSIEEINKIVDIVLSDQDVQDELNNRILAKNLEDLKKRRAFEEGEMRGQKIGEKRGEKRGEKIKSIEIAKKLIDEGMEIETIARITELTEEEITKLREV